MTSHFRLRLSVPLKVLLITALAVSFSAASVDAACDPLIYREGIKVKCTDPATKGAVDCYSRQTPIPVGTIAKYNCESPFYLPTNSDLTDRERTLSCNSRGKWAGGLPKFHLYSCTLNCGVTDVGTFASFVAGGIVSKQSDWPWHATIWLRPRSDREFTYSCGGSLIKPFGAKGFLVVTAAHCVATALNTARNVNDVVVALGSEESHLQGFEEHSPDGKIYKVREIVIHKSYEGARSDYQSDIALLRLTEPVVVKPNILPVCLSKSAALPDVGEVGHIVGFGYYNKESAASIQLRRASFSVVSSDKCFEWRSKKLLPQEYCAGTDNLQNACNGDSGGGMVFNGTDDNGRKRFFLQGIVSHGRVHVEEEAGCDTYSVYTKVSRYVDWIYATAERLFEEDDEEPSASVPSRPPPAPPALTRPTTGTTTTTTTTRRPTRPHTTTAHPAPPAFPSFPESPSNSNPDVELVDVSQESTQGAKDYELEGLNRHNYYRKLHGVAPLRLSLTLNRHAQANAEKQIREGTFTNQYEHGVNKNIYKFHGPYKSGPEAVRQAVDKWYDDISKYNWARPSYTTFSQVVWKNTLEMGVGFASSSGPGSRLVEQIVIVSYSPPGNVQGQFHENVLPKRTR